MSDDQELGTDARLEALRRDLMNQGPNRPHKPGLIRRLLAALARLVKALTGHSAG